MAKKEIMIHGGQVTVSHHYCGATNSIASEKAPAKVIILTGDDILSATLAPRSICPDKPTVKDLEKRIVAQDKEIDKLKYRLGELERFYSVHCKESMKFTKAETKNPDRIIYPIETDDRGLIGVVSNGIVIGFKEDGSVHLSEMADNLSYSWLPKVGHAAIAIRKFFGVDK